MQIVNNILLVLIAMMTLAACIMRYRFNRAGMADSGAPGLPRPTDGEVSSGGVRERYEWLIFAALMLLGIIIRIWNFPNVPGGLNQDEASIGYDAWALANYGIDRNGMPFPIYPIAWGNGHGPFYMYFVMPFIKLFGLTEFVYRLPNLLLGIVSMALFYLTVKRIDGVKTGLLGLALIAVMPWSILSSRWALDGNPLPSVFMITVYLFTLASDKQKTWLWLLCAAFAALSMYVYGPGIVVAPLFLLLACLYMLYHKRLRPKQFFLGIGLFIVLAFPLGLFMLINTLDLPPIMTGVVSFGKFTVSRGSVVFLPFGADYLWRLLLNLPNYLEIVFVQRVDPAIWNMVPGFGTTYWFSGPLILAGLVWLVVSCKKLKQYNKQILFLIWFIAASVYTIMVFPNVNRVAIIYYPVVYLLLRGIVFVSRQRKAFGYAVLGAAALSFVLFSYSYFNTYPDRVGPSFYESLGEAVTDAAERTDGTVYVTNTGINGAGIVTLFYSQTPPDVFADTVEYRDPNAENRHPKSYGRFIFGTPKDKDENAVYVIHNSETKAFEGFTIERYKNFSVAYKGGAG